MLKTGKRKGKEKQKKRKREKKTNAKKKRNERKEKGKERKEQKRIRKAKKTPDETKRMGHVPGYNERRTGFSTSQRSPAGARWAVSLTAQACKNK